MRILLLVLLARAQVLAAPHPFDPLDEAELAKAVEVLDRAGKLGGGVLFPVLALQEPRKADVLSGKAVPREAFAVLYDRRKNRTYEAVVDLSAGRVASFKYVPGAQPPVMLSEFEELPKVVQEDRRWRAALRKRGLEPEDVAVDVWAYGTPDSELSQKARLVRALAYFKGKGKNFYARPIEGLSAIVDAGARRVERVLDTAVVPVPPESSELDRASLGPQRAALKSLEVVQAQGPSFRLSGGEVSWDRWRFRWSMHPREGLVLRQVAYQDGGRLRPVLYRASLSEMMVPYGDPDAGWTFRAAFDEGEYGIGRYSASLSTGSDVPANAVLLDAVFADDFGKPYRAKGVVAVYERDGGMLWKHYDMYHGVNHSRRGRELVIGFVTTISNYDYALNWVFRQDGSIELEAALTGIMLAKAVPPAAEGHEGHEHSRFWHLVAPGVAAPHHQHFFNFRLDLDVDGADGDSPFELDARPLPPPDNPTLNAFEMVETPIQGERSAARELSFAAQRKWKVVDSSRRNRLGGRPGWMLIPGENAAPYLDESSPLRARGGFIERPVWFTRHRDGELYAAGPYPNLRLSSDGLPAWVARDLPLAGQDVVLWYTFCVTHAPRPEEWPVMPAHRTGFKLVPAGFFDRNPALDVP